MRFEGGHGGGRQLDVLPEERWSNCKKDVLFDTQQMFSRSTRNVSMLAVMENHSIFLKNHIKHQTGFALFVFYFLFYNVSNHTKMLVGCVMC